MLYESSIVTGPLLLPEETGVPGEKLKTLFTHATEENLQKTAEISTTVKVRAWEAMHQAQCQQHPTTA